MIYSDNLTNRELLLNKNNNLLIISVSGVTIIISLNNKRIVMKKILTLIVAAFVAAGSFMFTACDIADEFIAPKDTWVRKVSSTGDSSYTYTWGEGENQKSVSFDVYVNYATKESDISFKSVGTASVTDTLKPGLNFILVPTADSNSASVKELLNLTSEVSNVDTLCIFKAAGEKFATSDSETATEDVSLTSQLWTIVYNLNHFEKSGKREFDNLTLIASESLSNLNWKRILWNIVGSQLGE